MTSILRNHYLWVLSLLLVNTCLCLVDAFQLLSIRHRPNNNINNGSLLPSVAKHRSALLASFDFDDDDNVGGGDSTSSSSSSSRRRQLQEKYHQPVDANNNIDDIFTPNLSDYSSTTTTTATTATTTTSRSVVKVEKFARLPVWPAWNGVFIFLLSRTFGPDVAARVEDWVGGRVCPNFFVAEQTSPFVMLVHHRHSFAAWDPLRRLQQTFFPEGFPAHPHRGFVTVTYCMKGGMKHRDSLGNRQRYGAEPHHRGKHTQWLTAGAGVLHEEMWDLTNSDNHHDNNPFSSFLRPSSQELYQLWLNLPAAYKLSSPRVVLLGGDDETPTVSTPTSTTLILCGTHADRRASVRPLGNDKDEEDDVTILHVRLAPGTTDWTHVVPARHATCLLYVRTGAISMNGNVVDTHHTAYLSSGSDSNSNSDSVLSVMNHGPHDVADFLWLSGRPLREPVAAQGSMVMNTPNEINEAYADYQAGKMGLPWDHELTDEEWQQHIQRFPSAYRERER